MITGQTTKSVANDLTSFRIRASIGDTGTSTRRIWSAIRGLPDDEATDWIHGKRPAPVTLDVGIPPREWSLGEDDIRFLDQTRGNRIRGKRPDPSNVEGGILRRLQRGGYLPDGSFLSYSGGRWSLDGKWVRLPYRGLSKILSRKRGLEGIDWRTLLYSVDWAARRVGPNYPWEDPRTTPETDDDSQIPHPVHERISPRRQTWGGRNGSVKTIFGAHIPSSDDVSASEWMRRWEALPQSERGPNAINKHRIPISLDVYRGRLRLRVRRDSGWRRIELGSHPHTWAKILTWALSPTNHQDRKDLNCIQQFMFADPKEPLIPAKDRRGITLLRNVLESNEMAEIDMESRTISVAGTSGLTYSIKPGRGAHGARFRVTGLGLPQTRMAPWNPRGHICIVERQQLRRLVIGDAITSVVLALLNDLSSQRHIDTLRRHIREFGPDSRYRVADRETEHLREAMMLNRRIIGNPVNARLRRYTVTMPRLWGVLLRSPLGERMTLTAMRANEPNVIFDGSQTRFSTTCMTDRNVVLMMLEASGWIRDREDEEVRGVRRVYMRTGTGPRDVGPLVERFCTLMEPELTAGNTRMINGPLWNYYERHNPGPSPLLPGTDQILE